MTDEKEKTLSIKDTSKLLFRMWSFANQWKFRFYFGFLVGCTSPFYHNFSISFITKQFTKVCVSGRMTDFVSTLIGVILLVLFGMIVYPLSFGMVYTTYSKISGEVKKVIFRHMEAVPISYVDKSGSGDLITRVTTDYNHAIQLVAYPVVGQGNPFALVFTIIASGIIIIWNNPLLGGISLLLGFANLFVINRFIKPLQIQENKVKEAASEASQGIINSLSGTMVSRIFGLNAYLKENYEQKTQDIFRYNTSLIRRKSILSLLTDLQSFISFAGVTGIGLYLSTKDLVDIPTVVFISTMQLALSQVVAELGRKFADLQKYIISAGRLFRFLDEKEEVIREDKVEVRKDAPALEISDLKFRYEEGTDYILNGLNLKVTKGEKLAIAGGSGGGKSTLFKLLLEFASTGEGKIKLFGNDLEDYSSRRVRSFFSYVPQDCYLFDTTIYENIVMGNTGAEEEKVWKALEDAYLKDFVLSLPEGLHTQVGERGSKLSGGQRQRIAIARAFFRNAPIILLDEATSALDSKSEEEVQRALDHLMAGRTSIVIAHRLSTIQNMDRIIVMEKGNIIEEGNHIHLMEKQGRYAKLYELQFA